MAKIFPSTLSDGKGRSDRIPCPRRLTPGIKHLIELLCELERGGGMAVVALERLVGWLELWVGLRK